MHVKIIKTSDPDWFKQALECYRNKQPFQLIDDARLGVSQEDFTSGLHLVVAAARRCHVPFQQIAQVLAGLGMCAAGVWLVMAALADPDPTSKLGLLVSGGITLILTGSLSVLRSLGMRWQVEVGDGGGFTASPA